MSSAELITGCRYLIRQVVHSTMARSIGEDNCLQSGSSSSSSMVPELRMEREGTGLDVEQLTVLLDGGEAFTERRREIGQFFAY